jgi:hypothetical protein
VVESQPSKLLVAGSIPVSRSSLRSLKTRVSFGWASHSGEGCAAEVRSTKADGSQKHSAAADRSAVSGEGIEPADWSAVSAKGTEPADWSAVSAKGTEPADLSAGAPTARRPM